MLLERCRTREGSGLTRKYSTRLEKLIWQETKYKVFLTLTTGHCSHWRGVPPGEKGRLVGQVSHLTSVVHFKDIRKNKISFTREILKCVFALNLHCLELALDSKSGK